MALSVNITVSMPPEMVEEMDEAKPSGWSRSRYVRTVIRQCDGTPFETPEESLPTIEELDAADASEGAA